MELTAEEIAIIENSRKAKAEKEERERLAARSSNDKALEIFNKKATKLNLLASDLVAEVNYLNRAITHEFDRRTTDTVFISRSESVTAEACGFTEFAPVAIRFTLDGSTIVVMLNTTSGSTWNHDVSEHAYTIDSDWTINTKVYHSNVDKKCARIVIDRLAKKIEKDMQKNLQKKREEAARVHVAAKYPSARKVCINKADEFGNYSYDAQELSGCHNYTKIRGMVTFTGDTLKIESMTYSIEAATYYDDKTLIEYPREQKIKVMQEEMNRKINALKQEHLAAIRLVITEAVMA